MVSCLVGVGDGRVGRVPAAAVQLATGRDLFCRHVGTVRLKRLDVIHHCVWIEGVDRIATRLR